MLNDMEKAYWTKVYVMFGTSLKEWWQIYSLDNPIMTEYNNPKIIGVERLVNIGYIDKNMDNFTQKFIDEVINVR